MSSFPAPLAPNGHIRIVFVAGRIPADPFALGVARLRARGLRVTFDDAFLANGHPYLAGTDEARLRDLVAAFADPTVDAIWCARGGYGSMRLLEHWRPELIPPASKVFLGYSDNTALHLALNGQGWVTCHGSVVTALGRLDDGTAEAVLDQHLQLLGQGLEQAPLLAGTPIAAGVTRGPLLGGNLSLLANLLPCAHLQLPAGTILLVEDIDEPLYRIDRMITGLALRGQLEGLGGVALGSFTRCGGEGTSAEDAAARLAGECFARLGVPVVGGLPIGHGDRDVAVPLGGWVELDGGGGTLSFLAGTLRGVEVAS